VVAGSLPQSREKNRRSSLEKQIISDLSNSYELIGVPLAGKRWTELREPAGEFGRTSQCSMIDWLFAKTAPKMIDIIAL
jgi:hypothetical protein